MLTYVKKSGHGKTGKIEKAGFEKKADTEITEKEKRRIFLF